MEIANNYITALDEIGSKFGLAIDWTQQNIQPYMQELMSRASNYKIAVSVMWILISIIILFIAYKTFKAEECNETDVGVNMTCICLSTLAILTIIWSLFIILKCIMLPELVFFSMLQSLI